MQVRFVEWHGGYQMWQFDDITVPLTNRLGKEKSKKLPSYIEQLKNELESMNSLVDLMPELGLLNIVKLAQALYPDLFLNYLLAKAKEFTNQRKKICIWNFLREVFGPISTIPLSKASEETKEFLYAIARNEYAYQCTRFIETNQKAINLSQESWVLYWMKGSSLFFKDYDFGKIKCSTIRKEVMVYYKDLLSSKTTFNTDSGISSVTRGMNYLTNYNPSIKHFVDIGATDVASLLNHLSVEAKTRNGERLSPGSIADVFQFCAAVTSFLMDSDNEIPKGFPRPQHNYFKDIVFRNIYKMEKRTSPIPDCVIDQIYLHIDELMPAHQTVFRIFDGTGLRVDGIVTLKEHCLDYNEAKQLWLLRHIPGKVLESRRKNRLPDEHQIGISQIEVDLIQAQIKETAKLRQKTGMEDIFLHEPTDGGKTVPVRVIDASSFNIAINRLIKKYNIVDEGGNLWHFQSRQFRKKVARNMIENGATLRELAHHFGHMSEHTGMKHYAEVAEAKLADLNTAFFKKKFEMELGPEQLAMYTEEERRALYVDFCMKHREVELGSCVRHISLGPCGKRSGKTNCAVCGNICTGKQYLPKWISLWKSQKKIVDELIVLYSREGITGYEHFREYQRELYLLQSYEATITKIIGINAFEKVAATTEG